MRMPYERKADETLPPLGRYIRARLRELKISEAQLSRKCDLSQTTIFHIIDGTSKSPGIANIIAVAKVLGLPPCLLVYAYMGEVKECEILRGSDEKKEIEAAKITLTNDDRAAIVLFKSLIQKVLTNIEGSEKTEKPPC
jgi:transcriptional regulator with XRE-family HTH domain